MTVQVHSSMVAALADDTQKYHDAIALANRFDGARGWGTGVHFGITMRTPSDPASEGFVAVPEDVTRNLSQDDKGVLLGLLYKAQMINVQRASKRLKNNYGIEVQT